MFATTTRLAALVVLLATALPSIAAGPTRRQTFDLGGLTVNLGEMADGLAQPDNVQILAPSQAARVKARAVRRRAAQYHINLCPGSFQACSLPSGSFECLDTTQELNACGACLEEGGMDCEKIPFIENVSCAASKCEIHSCVEGYRPNLDKTACVPISNSRRFHKRH
ncbi:hypothetical protein P389DRAFT_212732 [Cystobasidium minutum MCA 4210]|uniref:uncharacterized protein n=1 Tax=Cystobasidium minutum MCA 4210 TaxID=1397322 RepID=UPI0034CEA273|eukprot:jgi/Rhomi1/212732/estExt_Genemark1.C_70249